MIIIWEMCQGQSCSLPFSSQVCYDDPDIPVVVFAPPVKDIFIDFDKDIAVEFFLI